MSFILLFGLILITSPSFSSEGLSFSATQKLGANEQSFVEKYKPIVKLKNADNLVQPAHSNNSSDTKQELIELKKLQMSRTKNDVKLIEHQRKMCRFDFPGYQIGYNKQFDQFLIQSFLDVSYYIFIYKIKNDRVRPSFLDKTLNPAIDIPPHPAYPSAHAGQSLILALMLSDIKLENKEKYLALAENIGRNRELAGVHYKSDTDSGQKIARIYYNHIKNTLRYKKLIKSVAKTGLQISSKHKYGNCEEILAKTLQPYR